MKRAFVWIIILVSMGNPFQIVGQEPEGTPVALTQLGPKRSGPRWSYSDSCFIEPMRVVIRDSETWKQTWRVMYGDVSCALPTKAPPPDIDFNQEMLIVAAMGMRPTGGYGIIIDKAYDRGDRLEVTVRSISPGSCGVFMAVTHPVDIVRMAKSERPMVFREIKAVMECKSGQPFTIRDEP